MLDIYVKLLNFFSKIEHSFSIDRLNSAKQYELKEAVLEVKDNNYFTKDFGEFNDRVISFAEVLKKENIDLGIFYKNMSSVKIKSYYGVNLLNNIILGSYNANNRIIRLRKGTENEALEHELLHVASSLKQDNVFYKGFYQKNGIIDIGSGLNEGYTQLLAERYFSFSRNNDINRNCYLIEKRYAKIIENIVGKNIMQNLYFKADLKGLVMELNKYADINEIFTFLTNLDLYKTISFENVDILENKLKCMNNFVIKTYMKKVLINNTFSIVKLNKLILEELRYKYEDLLYGQIVTITVFDINKIMNYVGDLVIENSKKILGLK